MSKSGSGGAPKTNGVDGTVAAAGAGSLAHNDATDTGGTAPAISQVPASGDAVGTGDITAAALSSPAGGDTAGAGDIAVAIPEVPARGGPAGAGDIAAAASGSRASGDTGGPGGTAAAIPEVPARGGPAAGESGMFALRRLDRSELALLCRDGLVNVLGDIERLANRLAGYRVDVLGALDELSRSGAAPDATPHLTLRDATGVSEREARRLRRVANKAREHTAVLNALTDGEINASQAEALCDARVPEEVRADLVADAATHDADTTRRRIREAETQHSVESPTERFLRQRAARGAGWGRDHDGMLRLWAKFDPETGAAVESTLEPLCRALWQQDKHQRTGRRTPAQRDADTLAYALAGITLTEQDAAVVDDLHARARRDDNAPSGQSGSGPAAPGPPQSKHAPPRGTPRFDGTGEPGDKSGLNSTGFDAGHEPGGSPAPSSSVEPGEPMRRLAPAQISVLIGLDALRDHTDQVGITDAGTELPPETVRRLACDAEIIPIILGGSGGSADIGRARRTVPLRLRRLLIARDKHCVWPGCHAPPSRCDAHHLTHWAKGGPTNLDNLALLCHTHHQHLHEHGYELVPGPDGWTSARKPRAP